MSALPNEPIELQEIYRRRFEAHLAYRNEVWKVLTHRFFSRYVAPSATVLDLGCGYGEFINNIQCGKKLAMDLNPGARKYLSPDVTYLEQDCSQPWDLPHESLDVVFTSNFFEHLPSRQLLGETLGQVYRALAEGGLLIAMGPNSRYIGGAYWDFWDHHIPLTDRSLHEALEIQGFQVEREVSRFLPYTMVNTRRYPVGFVTMYLLFPLAWKIMGKQFLLIARKPAR
jgi:SAM-dependent methyltransferase